MTLTDASFVRSRTRELPGNCPFTVKELLINQSVKRWSALAQDCFDEIEHILTSHVDRLVDTHFLKYEHGGLRDTVMCASTSVFACVVLFPP